MLYIALFAALASICSASPILYGGDDEMPRNITDETLDERAVGPLCQFNEYLATSPTDASPGDGDLHQNYYHIQLSDNVNCGSGSCSVGETDASSFSVGFTLGTNSNFKPTFFQGGLSVSESWETGNDYTCDADSTQVCIWQNVAHTAVS